MKGAKDSEHVSYDMCHMECMMCQRQSQSESQSESPKLALMESRKLAAILSSLVSQLLLLLLLLNHNHRPPNSNSTLPLLLFSHHHLFSILTTLTLTLSKRNHHRNHNHNNKRKRHTPSPHNLTPDSFRNTFMMTSSSFQWLSGLLEPLLDCRDPPHLLPFNLSSSTRLAIGLSRLASGHHYPQISAHFSVSVPVAQFCVKQLCRVLCTNFRFWLSFPNPSDLISVSRRFQTLANLPNCCGVVSCARFQFSNVNGSTSRVAAQLVVDSSCRILTIVAGFQGDKTDSEILKASTLFHDVQQGTLLNDAAFDQYLIGDSRYPLFPWLMVPYVDAIPGSLEADFNSALQVMRLPALRTVASLRNWGVLSRPVSEDVKMVVAYIGACSILHNGLLMREDFSALASGFEDSGAENCNMLQEEEGVSSKALALRDELAKKLRESKSS